MNRNLSIKFIENNNQIKVDKEILDYKNPKRGIYGIFNETSDGTICIYVGKAENMYQRFFTGNGHICSIRKKLNTSDWYNNTNWHLMDIRVLKDVPCTFESYEFDMSKLAYEELKIIMKYQMEGQCQYQLPEGAHLSRKEWEKEKRNCL